MNTSSDHLFGNMYTGSNLVGAHLLGGGGGGGVGNIHMTFD